MNAELFLGTFNESIDKFIIDVNDSHELYQNSLYQQNERTNIGRLVDDYKMKIYVFLNRHTQFERDLYIFERQIPSATATTIHNVLRPLKAKMFQIHVLLRERIRNLFQTREEIIIQHRNRFLQNGNTPCNCKSVVYQLDSSSITTCGICLEENISGIHLECCQMKQSICVSCQYISLCQQFKKRLNCSLDNINIERLFSMHYTCNFCRQDTCFKKYYYLLNPEQ